MATQAQNAPASPWASVEAPAEVDSFAKPAKPSLEGSPFIGWVKHATAHRDKAFTITLPKEVAEDAAYLLRRAGQKQDPKVTVLVRQTDNENGTVKLRYQVRK